MSKNKWKQKENQEDNRNLGGRPSIDPNGEVEKLSCVISRELFEKIEMKVRSLKSRGFNVDSSKIQRVIIEKNIDDVDRFFKQELITR